MNTRQYEAKRHEIKVVLTIIASIAILIYVIFTVGSEHSILRDRYQLKVYMTRVNGLQPGAPVRVNGVNVGSVVKVDFSDNLEDSKIHVTLEVVKDAQNRIRKDSKAQIGTLGLLGDKFVAISMGSPDQPFLRNGDELQGAEPVDMENLIAEGVETMQQMQETVYHLNDLTRKINQGEGSLGKFVNEDNLYNDLDRVFLAVLEIAELLNNADGSIQKMLVDPELYDNINYFLVNTNKMVDTLQQGDNTLAKLASDPMLYDKTLANLEELNSILSKLDRGEGTFGKMLGNDSLYNELVNSTQNLDSLLNDIRANPKKYVTVEIF